MTQQRLGVVLAALLMILAIVAGLWLSQRLTSMLSSPSATPVATATETQPSPIASPTVLQVPKGFRLAGVAENVDQTYAVIESPDGRHSLYRLHDEIQGLGRLARIGSERVVVATTNGELTLWVAPAATVTPTVTRRLTTATPRRRPSPTLTAGGTALGSTPSSVPGRRAF
jgi:hypothetical protein